MSSNQRYQYIQECIVANDVNGLPRFLPEQHQWDSVFLMLTGARTVNLRMAKKLVELGCSVSAQHVVQHIRNIELIAQNCPERIQENMNVLDFFLEQAKLNPKQTDVAIDMLCSCTYQIIHYIGAHNMVCAYMVFEHLLDHVDFNTNATQKLATLQEAMLETGDDRIISCYECRRDSNEYVLK